MKTDVLNKNSNEYGGGHKGIVTLADATTATLTAKQSGKLIVVPDLSASCTISLPAEAIGLEYDIVYGGAAADAQNFILDSGADANYFVGSVLHADLDAGSGGDEVAAVFSDGNSNSKLTVTTPSAGTSVKIVCDGQKWYVTGLVISDTAPAFADQ